jgi:hypothetical protein
VGSHHTTGQLSTRVHADKKLESTENAQHIVVLFALLSSLFHLNQTRRLWAFRQQCTLLQQAVASAGQAACKNKQPSVGCFSNVSIESMGHFERWSTRGTRVADLLILCQ